MKRRSSFLPLLLILLTCVISLRFLLFLSYIQLQKTEFRKQLILKEFRELKHFTFSGENLFKDQKGFEWKEGNQELVVNDVYYEVVNVSKNKTGFTVAVIEDKDENSLFEKYYSLNDDLHSQGLDLVKHLTSLIYLSPHFNYNLKTDFTEVKKITSDSRFNTKIFIPVGVKPPEQSLSMA